jgi:hypothetical protein
MTQRDVGRDMEEQVAMGLTYHSPELRDHGSLADLTASGGSQDDGLDGAGYGPHGQPTGGS